MRSKKYVSVWWGQYVARAGSFCHCMAGSLFHSNYCTGYFLPTLGSYFPELNISMGLSTLWSHYHDLLHNLTCANAWDLFLLWRDHYFIRICAWDLCFSTLGSYWTELNIYYYINQEHYGAPTRGTDPSSPPPRPNVRILGGKGGGGVGGWARIIHSGLTIVTALRNFTASLAT